MRYLIDNFKKTWEFIRETKSSYVDILLMHGFLMFFLTPFLVSATQFILRQGGIAYISYDNLGMIFSQHPFVFLGLIGMLLLLVTSVFFEFTFLLLSVYFIKIKKKISLKQLLKGTLLQLKKIRFGTLLFFLFYFFLVLPLSGIKFNSELLAKFQIPVFILDVIFENRVAFIALFVLFYLILIYIAIRLIFALPEMILKDKPFKESVKFSWQETKGSFLRILSQFVIVMGTFAIVSGLSTTVIILVQDLIETSAPKYALGSAIFLMTALQVVWLINLIFSTVGIFFVTIDNLGVRNFLPATLSWYKEETPKEQANWQKHLKSTGLVVLIIGLVVVVGTSNAEFLSNPASVKPITVSHRGVDNKNGAQNTIDSLIKTSTDTHPDYIEMDVQETKDQQFVVFHDFNMKNLTGENVKPNQLTLDELTTFTVKENGKEEPVASFDDYLAKANELNQKLLIEIKPTKDDSPEMIDNFIKKYGDDIIEHGHTIQSLSFDIVAELKEKKPEFVVGYIMPFSVVGPPEGDMDFFTLEYTTLNSNFIDSANAQGKAVYAWTPNDEDTMSRMMFYGIDGMITDQMTILNKTVKDNENITYSDKLLYFVIGIG
ncbi:glycerophosphodiester phosphodiesterase [Vagococcus sp. DIV0080]|uniref:Glycerophosphodiester phosphodiesterase n=1 Tax=Candidatus Vagococcus giribetii TaxID=2230876 RepID=A0ABS3HQ54_9ENTE|nr:glycerophosphodiester phosphodiesterase [Vagococcus sp. DIV0080]MBO0475876.1 glycerophosphodiester phosphodiesterase [Vagococcus sp. DIV0080]